MTNDKTYEKFHILIRSPPVPAIEEHSNLVSTLGIIIPKMHEHRESLSLKISHMTSICGLSNEFQTLNSSNRRSRPKLFQCIYREKRNSIKSTNFRTNQKNLSFFQFSGERIQFILITHVYNILMRYAIEYEDLNNDVGNLKSWQLTLHSLTQWTVIELRHSTTLLNVSLHQNIHSVQLICFRLRFSMYSFYWENIIASMAMENKMKRRHTFRNSWKMDSWVEQWVDTFERFEN